MKPLRVHGPMIGEYRISDGPFTPLRMKPKVVVGYPVGGSVTLPFHASMLQLLAYEITKPDHERLLSKISHTQGLYVGDNRNMLAQEFMKTDAEWLLQIDTDIEFPKTLLETMVGLTLNQSVAGERKIVAANVPLGGGFETVAFQWDPQAGIWANYKSLPEDLFRCDAAATAVMLVHREVFEEIASAHGQCWFHHMYIPKSPEGTRPADFEFHSIGEDTAFCQRAKAAGYQTWVARVPGLRHHKTRALSEDFGRAMSMAGEDSGVGELVREG